MSSKKGLTTNATKIQKKPTDIKFKAKPEVSINNNGVADLNQATKAYTQILLDEAKRMIDLNEFVVANRLIQLAEQPMTPSRTSRTIRMSRCLRRRPSDKAEDPLRGQSSSLNPRSKSIRLRVNGITPTLSLIELMTA